MLVLIREVVEKELSCKVLQQRMEASAWSDPTVPEPVAVAGGANDASVWRAFVDLLLDLVRQTNDSNRKKITTAVNTLGIYVSNVLKDPKDEKFRKIGGCMHTYFCFFCFSLRQK